MFYSRVKGVTDFFRLVVVERFDLFLKSQQGRTRKVLSVDQKKDFRVCFLNDYNKRVKVILVIKGTKEKEITVFSLENSFKKREPLINVTAENISKTKNYREKGCVQEKVNYKN